MGVALQFSGRCGPNFDSLLKRLAKYKRAIGSAAGKDGGRPLQEWSMLLRASLARYTAATILIASGKQALRSGRYADSFLLLSPRGTRPLVKDRVNDRDRDRDRQTDGQTDRHTLAHNSEASEPNFAVFLLFLRVLPWCSDPYTPKKREPSIKRETANEQQQKKVTNKNDNARKNVKRENINQRRDRKTRKLVRLRNELKLVAKLSGEM